MKGNFIYDKFINSSSIFPSLEISGRKEKQIDRQIDGLLECVSVYTINQATTVLTLV